MKKNAVNLDLIESFTEMYSPASSEDKSDVIMDYAKIREFFGCLCLEDGKNDSLFAYLSALNKYGFSMCTSFSNVPCLFLKYKRRPTRCCPEIDETSPSAVSLPEKPILAKFPSDLKTLDR